MASIYPLPLLFVLQALTLPFLAATAGCQENEPIYVPDEVFHEDWSTFFDAYDATGTIVMLDSETGTRHVFNPDRSRAQFPPASTFKIYNSLVALETGVVPNVDTVYTWDGVERGGAWDQDHSLRTGLQRSAVWLFQELAIEIGKERYEEAFVREPYGNNLVGDSLHMFWLGEPLAISASEQITFLNRLRKRELAFRLEVQEAIGEIMILENEDDYVLRGKTGWAIPESGDIGWIVGWIERGNVAWVFALNVEANGPNFDMRTARRGILDAVLNEIGLRPLER